MAPFVKAGQIIVCVAKGIEENTLMTLSDIVEEEVPAAEVAVMCGPSHAEGLASDCRRPLLPEQRSARWQRACRIFS